MQLISFLMIWVLGTFATALPLYAQSEIFAGEWETDWGPTKVFSDGSDFSGSYKADDGDTANDGTFTLSKTGKTWTGYWVESLSNEKCSTEKFGSLYWGTLELRTAFSKDGFSLHWGYCEDKDPSRLWVFNAKTRDLAASTSPTVPAEIGPVVLDNWNKGGCGFTDTIQFTLSSEHDVGLVRTWINWPEGVQTVPYEVMYDGAVLLNGNFARNSCDTYQQSWCQGVATWNTRLEIGQYSIKTDLARVCQNSGSKGNGYISLYEAAQPIVNDTSGDGAGADGQISVGDFSQRRPPFDYNEATVGDFSSVFATTQGIIIKRNSGVKIAVGSAPPGDIDVVLVGLSEDGDMEFTLNPCSRSARLTVYDIEGNILAVTGDVVSGYSLYASVKVPNLKKGAYALAVEFPDGSLCDDGENGWSIGAEGSITDPIGFVGPFEDANKPDYTVREDLNVDDLVRDLQAIIK